MTREMSYVFNREMLKCGFNKCGDREKERGARWTPMERK